MKPRKPQTAPTSGTGEFTVVLPVNAIRAAAVEIIRAAILRERQLDQIFAIVAAVRALPTAGTQERPQPQPVSPRGRRWASRRSNRPR
jgi:hypothetical protein